MSDVETMLRSGDPALLGRYGVDFVVIGPSERESFGAREERFAGRYKVAAEGADTRVFDGRPSGRRDVEGD